MTCYSPVRAYWSKRKHPSTGNDYLVFKPSQGKTTDFFTVPCGKCEGCLLDRAFAWSIRCTCESFYHSENYFLTLTYDRAHLPEDGMLNRVHVTQFIKRLRRAFSGVRIRVFYCGEYGPRRGRPHYHMIVFGLPLAANNYRLLYHSTSKKGYRNYVCSVISEKWPFGLATVGSFSSSSASYVAQYTLKKNKENFYYSCFSQQALYKKQTFVKPFIGMSNRPAIAQQFFDEYYQDIFSKGSFSISLGNDVKRIRPLKFFVRKLKESFPVLYHSLYTRPLRLFKFKFSCLPLSQKAELLDRKLKNRYIKEERTLRKLEARSDL